MSALALTAATAAEPPPPTREELFQQVFGHPQPPYPIESHVLVVIDGTTRQKLRAETAPDASEVRLEAAPLILLLSQLLRAEPVQQLQQRIDSRGLLDRSALEQAGIGATFEPRSFEYRLSTTASMRAPRTVQLTPALPDPLAEQALRPDRVSGFVNFNIKGSERKGSGAAGPARSLGIALDGALNLRRLVLEGSAFGHSGGAWRRGDLRAVHDRPPQAQRIAAGDLIVAAVGYQLPLPVGGISFSKDYSLQPQLLTYWTGGLTFALDRPAEVKILRNDSLVSTLQLDAGLHDLRRFTPVSGLNEFDIVIEDAAVRREVMHYSFVHDPALLDRGLSRYSWNAGFARQSSGGGYSYDTSQPAFAGAYLRGITTSFTLGAYGQATHDRMLVGSQQLRALPLGTLLLDTALSRVRTGELDAAARVTLTSTAVRGGAETRISIGYEGRHFNAGIANRQSRATLDAQASMALPLHRRLTGTLGARYLSAASRNASATYGAAAALHQSWDRLTATLVLRHERTAGRAAETALLFGLRAHFTDQTGSYQATREPESGQASARWNSARRGTLSTPFGFAQLRADAGWREYQAGGGYLGNQGMAEATYLRRDNGNAGQSDAREELSMRLEGALAFAGGTFALSRTVRENFVIVAGKQGLRNATMRVDPDSRGREQARSSWLGPAVLPSLNSYRLRTLRIEPLDAPIGTVPDNLNFRLAPTYKSGLLLQIGRELRIVAIGRLVDAGGAPLAHLRIDVRRADGDEEPVATFTGSNGNFQAPGLQPGRYEIRTDGRQTMVDIPAAPDGILRLGDVVLPPR